MAEAGKNGHPDERPAPAESNDNSPEFLRSLVHELRNPLAPIRNAAELLRTLCSDPRQLQSVEIIARQVTSLTRALDDLTRAISSKESHLSLSKQSVDLTLVIEPALRVIRPLVDAHRQNLLVALPNDPVQMHCDPLRLTQVVQVLLENAARHTPAGGSIALQVSRLADQLVIEVRDDGAGIAADRLPAIFNVFAQRPPSASDAETPRVRLAICRNIVEMHGGTIEAFSEGVGRGSRFTIHLPLVIEARDNTSPEPAAPTGSRRIIVIDDHEDSLSSLRDVLAAAGHAVLAANTGELGVALAEGFKPHAVVIDIGLPGIDGFEVARRLRANPATAGALLIALSGFSLKQFRDLSAYAAFRHYLLKPASPETILMIIEKTFDQGTGRSRGRE